MDCRASMGFGFTHTDPLMTESKELQPRSEGGTFKRKHGIRALEQGHLTPNELATIAELRKSFREQGFRDDLIETLAARTLMIDMYMFGEFLKRFSERKGDIDGLYGRLTASASSMSRLVREIERREREGVITISDLVEGESREVDGDEETNSETDQD